MQIVARCLDDACFDEDLGLTSEEILDYTRAIAKVCEMKGVEAEGFRMISNARHNGVQEVPHLHVHILGGRNLGRMLTPA